MAVVIPEVAEAAAGGEAAAASKGLSPAAQSAVSSAAAGHGKHLTPEVATELRKAASRKSTPAPEAPAGSSDSGGGGGGSGVGRSVSRSTGAALNQGAKVISGGKGGTAARIIFAFGAGLLALEFASYLSGRYFTYHVGQGADKAKQASQVMGLYPGQLDKLKAQNSPPITAASVGLNHYGGTATL